MDFNPRSRVGNDVTFTTMSDKVNISIHVPAWGTTDGIRKPGIYPAISIHVPAWGTTLAEYQQKMGIKFQSTFPRGERHGRIRIRGQVHNFNPRSRVGNDLAALPTLCIAPRFQSTFPRGERPPGGAFTTWSMDFNPRSRVGNDVTPIKNGTVIYQFQSTFPRGERPSSGSMSNTPRNFNPRSRVGNDGILIVSICACNISIHVPAWGTTCCVEECFLHCVISIHVPAWGTTANFHKYSLLFYAINIIFLLFIIPSLLSLVLFVLLF